MTFRNAGVNPAGSSVSSVQITLGANIQPDDIITVGAVFGGNHSASTALNIVSSNGGSFIDLSGWQIVGSSRTTQVFKRVAIAGDASSTITISTSAGTVGRAVAFYHAESGLDTSATPVVFGSTGSSSNIIDFPAATPTPGWSGGTAVYYHADTAASGGQATFDAALSGISIRAQTNSGGGSGTNVAAFVGDLPFPDDTQIAARSVNASIGVGSRIQLVILYLESSAAKPIANAGPDQNVLAGATVNLDGSASANGGAGAPYTWQWTQVSGPAVTLNDPTAENPTFTAPGVSSSVVLQLIATDAGAVASDPDTVTINVLGAEDTAYPDANVTVTNWTPNTAAAVWEVLSDGTDTTWVTSSDNPSSLLLRVGISELTDPTSPGDAVNLTVRCRKNNASTGTVTVQLVEGASTVRATLLNAAISDSFGNVTLGFTPAEYDSVTDWKNVDVAVTVTAAT